jgi:hypothetical protein
MATTTPTPSRTSVPRDEYLPTGWATFAAIILFVGGFFSAMWGLAAILNDEVVRVGGQGVMVADFTTWGWVQLLLGVFMGLTAGGLLTGQNWARWSAILFATINAMVQVAGFSAFPLYALTVITLDVIVIYQLTANYRPARN